MYINATLSRIISLLIIFSLINLSSCVSHRYESNMQRLKSKDLNTYKSVKVIKISGEKIRLKQAYIENDHIHGKNDQGDDVTIPLLEVRKVLLAKKSGTSMAAGIGLGLIIAIILGAVIILPIKM